MAARRDAAGKAGRAKPSGLTEAEKADKRRASRIARGVFLDLVLAERASFRRHKRALRLLDASLKRELTPAEQRYIREHRWTNQDMQFTRRDYADRYGDPRRSKQDVALDGAPVPILALPAGLWEDESDAPTAGAPAHGGH